MKPDLVIPPGVWFPCKCFQNKMFSEAKNLCFIFYKKLGNDLIFRLFPYKKKKILPFFLSVFCWRVNDS